MIHPDSPEVESIFNAAIDKKSTKERLAYLDGACGNNADLRDRVEALLLAYDEAGNVIDESPSDSARTLKSEMGGERPGTTIGRYKILQKIGEGGFGVVYMAEQQRPVVRRVALKVIKLGMDTKQVIGRFEAERQALAMMDHPCIAKVLDAGATDTGRPFFVMELVKGIPLTDYCDQNNLTTNERLELFIEICGAIQHAHQKGVIHRDLKPSNVMITLHDGRPVPKVIDFGIAKATSQRLTEKTVFTEFKQFIGTPEYMSPEQAEMSGLDVDTRSDVYSLGVLLYELLTGRTPFDSNILRTKSHFEIQRIIREEEPQKPSTLLSTMMGETLTDVARRRRTDAVHLRKVMRGDLDWIVLKAIEKDRTRRYDTANGLGMDIRRFLNNEPVLATPPSASYRFRKFIRRNKTPLTLAAAVFLVAVIGGIVSLVFGVAAVKARDEMNVARQEAQQAFENEAVEHDRAEAALVEAQTAREAEAEARSQAEAARVTAEKRAYSAALHAAAGDLERNDVRSLRRQLDGAPEHLRGWEWDYLYHEADRSIDTPLELPPASQGYALRLSPDASRLAVRDVELDSGPIRIYDTHTGEMLRELATVSSNYPNFTFSRDNRWLGYDHRGLKHFQIYDLVNGSRLLQGDDAKDAKTFLGFDPTCTRAAVRMTEQGTLSLYELEGWKQIASRDDVLPDEYDFDRIEGLFSPDGAVLAVAYRDKAPVRIFSAEDLSLVHEFDDTPDICSIAFADDGSRFATLSVSPPMIAIYDPASWEELRRINLGGEAWQGEVRFFRNEAGQLELAATRRDGTIDIVRESGTHIMTLRGENSGAQSIAFDADHREFISAHARGALRRWDSVRSGQGFTPAALALSIAPDGRTVQTGTSSGRAIDFEQLGSFDLVSRRLLGSYRYVPTSLIHSSQVIDLARSPDGRFMATATMSGWDQGRLKIFDLQTGLGVFSDDEFEEDDLRSVAWSGDGATLAVAGLRGIIYLYDGTTYEPKGRLFGHYATVHDLLFAPDGVTLYAADAGGMLRMWNTASRTELRAAGEAGDPALRCLTLSNDRRLLLAGGEDGRIHAWDADSLEPIATLDAHGGSVRTLAFSPDGSRLASGSLDRSVKLWNPAPGMWEEILTLRTAAGVNDFEFTPDGSRLVMLLSNGTMRSFDAKPETARVEERRAERTARTEARSLVSSLMSRYEDPAVIRPLVVNDDTITDAVREAALIELQVETLKLVREAYDYDRWWAELVPPFDRWILTDLIVSNGDGWVDTKRFAEYIAAQPGRTEIERQAAKEYASGMRFNSVVTNDVASKSAIKPGQSEADYALALIASEADNRAYQNQPTNLATLALCECRCGLYEQSIETATRSLSLRSPEEQPGHPETLAVLALAHTRLGHDEQARSFLDQAKSQLDTDRYRKDDGSRSFVEEVAAVLERPEAERVLETAIREQVIETWKACVTSELGEIDARISLAKLAEHEGDYDEMQKQCRKAIDAMRLRDGGDTPQVGAQLRWLGQQLRTHQQNEDAAAVMREAWMTFERTAGPDHDWTTFALEDLQSIQIFNLERFAEGEPLARQTLDSVRRLRGETSKLAAWRSVDLGYCLARQEMYGEAEPLYLDALRIMRALQAEDHQDVAWAIGAVRWLYLTSQEFDKLEAFQRENIKVARERLGDENQEVLDRTGSLADAIWQQERQDEAITLFRQCLDLARSIHGEQSQEVFDRTARLADALSQQGRHDEAITMLRQNLDLARNIHGQESQEVLDRTARLAEAIWQQERHDEAITLFRQCIDLARNIHGEESQEVFNRTGRLANALSQQGHHDEAINLFRQNLDLARNIHGEESWEFINASIGLGNALGRQQHFADAAAVFRACIPLAISVHGDQHTLLDGLYLAVAQLLLRDEQHVQSLTAYEEAVEFGRQHREESSDFRYNILVQYMSVLMDHGPVERQFEVSGELLALVRKHWSMDEGRFSTGLIYHGITLLRTGRFAEAEPLLRECLKIRERLYQDQATQWLIHNTRSWLGEALTGQERYDEAEPLLVDSAEAILADEAPPLLRKRQAVQRVIAFYTAQARSEDAEVWQARLAELNEEPPPAGN